MWNFDGCYIATIPVFLDVCFVCISGQFGYTFSSFLDGNNYMMFCIKKNEFLKYDMEETSSNSLLVNCQFT